MNLLPSSFANTTELLLSFDELDHNPKDIITILGYADGEVPEHLYEIYDEVISKARSLCQIRGGYRYFSDVVRQNDNVHYRIKNVDFVLGKTISAQLQKAQSVGLFLCTIGDSLVTWASQLMSKGDFFKGYMADAVASQTVELAVDKIQAYIEADQLHRGMKITNRYSPGYCGWHVSEQHKLFSLLPKNFCDITLTESSLMLPIKSVSGIIGIGPNVRRMDYTCRLCDKTDCIYRRRFEKSRQDA